MPTALLVVLLAGAALRVALFASYTPAYLSYPDTWGYVKAAAGPLFMDNWIRPVGYPVFLDVVHAVWSSLTFVIVVQHVLGLVTAVLAYLTLRRLGAPVWVAVVPAAVAALSLDLVYFEHTLLSESLFVALFTAALYATARTLGSSAVRAATAWAALAALLLAAGAVVRGAGLFAIPVVGLALLLGAGPLRLRLLRTGAMAAVVLACLVGYASVNQAETGAFGLTEGGGWAAYSRAAPFADCRVFTPPQGTEMLCESSDPRTRGGPDFYSWDPGSVGRKFFVGPPFNADTVGAFGRAATLAQPKAFLSAVATDLWRYVDPDAGPARPGNGAEPGALALDLRDPSAEERNRGEVEPFYGEYRTEVDGLVANLADLQEVLRVHGVFVLLAVLLSLVALPFARSGQRVAILLLGGTAVASIALATATTVYNWRYAVPVLPVLMASGALGLHVLAGYARERLSKAPAARVTASPPGARSSRSRTPSTTR